jgi:hypothetical protein
MQSKQSEILSICLGSDVYIDLVNTFLDKRTHYLVIFHLLEQKYQLCRLDEKQDDFEMLDDF